MKGKSKMFSSELSELSNESLIGFIKTCEIREKVAKEMLANRKEKGCHVNTTDYMIRVEKKGVWGFALGERAN